MCNYRGSKCCRLMIVFDVVILLFELIVYIKSGVNAVCLNAFWQLKNIDMYK